MTRPLKQGKLRQKHFSITEKSECQKAILKLINQGAVVPCHYNKGQFLSPFFLVEKSNGSKRFILNLKRLNKYIEAKHFKMEDYRTVTKLVQKNFFMRQSI